MRFFDNQSHMISVELGLYRYSIFLLAFCTSLEGQTTVNLTVYATSAFYQFPLVATVYVVQGVVNGAYHSAAIRLCKINHHSCHQATYG